MKKVISLFLSIVMISTSILCVDLSACAAEFTISNRAQWLSQLAKTFDMTVESDNYPDNYFSDLTEDSEYYYDILLAVEFGVVDIEAGGPVDPEGEITREFAAQTLNFCLGYDLDYAENEQYEYTFSDYNDCLYPDDDQIAVNRGWFELDTNSNFCPENIVTASEITFMLNDAKAQEQSTVVEENYDSSVEVAKSVIEIENGTEVSVDENDTVTITNCPKTINNGDNFVVYLYDIPKAYVASSVTVDDKKTIITTKEADTNEAFENIDVQEISQINDAEFIPAEGLEIIDEEMPSTYSSDSSSFSTKPIDALNNVTIGGKMTVDGVSVLISAKIKNPELETKINNSQTYIAINSNLDVNYSVTAKSSNVKSIPLGYWNIFGVGYFKVSLDASLKGGITVTEKVKFTMGTNYTKNDGARPVVKISHDDFQIAVDATLKVGIKVELGVSIAIVKADIYCFFGVSAKASVTGYPSGEPQSCASLSAYFAVNVGVELQINSFFDSKTYSIEKAFFDEKNSPIKLAFHFEDGKKVDKCKRGEAIKYTTPNTSKYYDTTNSILIDSNSCGTNVYWSLDAAGTLTIFGTGEMEDVYSSSDRPGYPYISSIKNVVIKQGVTSIGDSAFENCYSLTSITIPDSITSIGDRAFFECESLTSITIPDSVTSIGDSAFENCYSLTSITIPDSITSIGDRAFCECESLTSVTIPDSVTSIGECTFWLCKSLTSVTIPDSVTSIGECTFWLCKSLTSITIPDSVTSIGDAAFCECESLTSITIPDSVTSIGDDAFFLCESLTSITIPDSVTSIGAGAFSATAYARDSSNWENGVLYIGNHLIEAELDMNGSYNIRAGTKVIAGSAFASCERLISVTIPDSVTSIGECAFYECERLTSVTIPDSVTSIGECTFASCERLTSVTIPDSVTSIGKRAFEYCYSLTSITIPDSVTSIGAGAFSRTAYDRDSSNWENGVLYIGNHLIKAEPDTMNGSYNIRAGTKVIAGSAFSDCTSLTSVTIPDSVTTICDGAFYQCESLTDITIPDSVTSIGDNVFWNCGSLTCVTIPDSVTSIGNNAFVNCTSLRDVYYSGTIEQWNKIGICDNHGYLANATTTIHCIDGVINEKEHTHSYSQNVTAPTCTEQGYTTYTCECGDRYNDNYVETIPHSYVGGICEMCNGKDPNYSYPTISVSDSVTTNITTPGEYAYFYFIPEESGYYHIESFGDCDTYGYLYDEDMNELAYNDDGDYNRNFAMRVYLEKDKKYIIGCRLYDEDEIGTFTVSVNKHTHSYYSDTIEATCTEQGYTIYICDCGDNYVDYVDATGHIWDAGIVTTEATCTATGVKTYTCTVCGAINTETIAEKAHTYKTATKKATISKNGSIVTKCSVCGSVSKNTVIYYPKTISLSTTSYTYNGKVKKPSVTVKDSKGKKISSKYYTVTYQSGRKNVGKYSVKITFKGNYSGSKILYFTINPKATALSSVTAKSKGFTVKWKKQTSQTTGYQLQYSTSSKFKSANTVTVSKNKTTAKTISKLKVKKKYYVRVRTYKTVKINGKSTKIYSSWSKVKSVTTKK